MTTPSAGGAGNGTVAGRPQPQTTIEAQGGPFVRHAPDGRRAQYVDTQQFGGFLSRPTVSMPGYAKGYRMFWQAPAATGTQTATAVPNPDAPWNVMQLVQMKDAFGTQLLTGPGYVIGFEVPLYSGQFGTDEMRSPASSPMWGPINTTSSASTGAFSFSTYFAFEFAKAYGVISGANAALLPVLQINVAPSSSVYSTAPTFVPTAQTQTLDSDFYWLPSAPTDPPGLGTTCQWIYQPSNPTIPANASQLVQLPRLGGYLTEMILEIRDANGVRAGANTGATADSPTNPNVWPTRPKILVDGVPLIDTLLGTWMEDIAIASQIGAVNGPASTSTATQGTVQTVRPTGTLALSRKTSLSQRDFGLLDTGEIFLSTNPGTQLEIGGFPWGTESGTAAAPYTLNATVGQVVPSGTLVQGLPEV